MLESPDLEVPELDEARVEALLARTVARSGRTRRRRLLAMASVVVAGMAAVASVTASVGGGGPPRARAGTTWRLVADVTAEFSAKAVSFTGVTLVCPGATACYASANAGGKLVLEVTQDAGATWTTATPPGAFNPTSLSCVDATTCAGLSTTSGGGVFVETEDAGATWTSAPFPAVADGIATVSCSSAARCTAVAESTSGSALALVTSDAGATWTSGELPVPQVAGSQLEVTGLSCDADGECTLLGSTYSGQTWQPFSLHSGDGGSTWSTGTVPSSFVPGYDFSCADATSCLAVGNTTGGAPLLLATHDAGMSWSAAALPAASGREFLNWDSCTAVACWVSGGSFGTSGSGGAHAFLEDSTDLGGTWTATSLPAAVDSIGNVACSGGSTCFALGAESGGRGASTLVLLSNASWAGAARG